MKKKKLVSISGIYHNLTVKIVSQKWIKRRFKGKESKDDITLGFYEHLEGEIFVGRELTPQVKRHTLYHEISHHILDTLEGVKDEETRCDLLGSYLMKLADDKEKIESHLKDEE